jgi:hypothetical protein
VDDWKKKWIETTIAWVGYFIVAIGVIALLLTAATELRERLQKQFVTLTAGDRQSITRI